MPDETLLISYCKYRETPLNLISLLWDSNMSFIWSSEKSWIWVMLDQMIQQSEKTKLHDSGVEKNM